MTFTDKLIFFSIIFLFWRGWSKGFAQTVLGPLALIIGTILSYIYYIVFRNLVIATAIGIILPIIINIIFSMTLGVLFLGNEKKNMSILSRFSGALINTFWGEFLILTGLFLVILIPLHLPLIDTAQNDIKQSYTYAELTNYLNKVFKIDVVNNFDPSKLQVLSDPKTLDALGKTKEFQEVLEDPLVQALLNDPETTQAIEAKDIGKLLQNPKFIALTKDPALLKKFLTLYTKILEKDKTNTPGAKAESSPTQTPKSQPHSKSP
jgi:ribosomal protein S18